jgi:hypothetical protein
MTGFPAAQCRVVASEISGDDAYVLLDTGSPGHPYLYGCSCSKKDGRWFDGLSSNGPSWSPMSDDSEVGGLSFWGDAPAGAEMVRVSVDGATVEAPVREGVYFLIWWRVPFPIDWPRVAAFRRNGVWT